MTFTNLKTKHKEFEDKITINNNFSPDMHAILHFPITWNIKKKTSDNIPTSNLKLIPTNYLKIYQKRYNGLIQMSKVSTYTFEAQAQLKYQPHWRPLLKFQ